MLLSIPKIPKKKTIGVSALQKTVARSKQFVATSMSRQSLTVQMNAHIGKRISVYVVYKYQCAL